MASKVIQQRSTTASGDLIFLRNHPRLVHHVAELLVVWGANIEGRPVRAIDTMRFRNLQYKYVSQIKVEKGLNFSYP